MKVPPKRKGNRKYEAAGHIFVDPSMKVPPKRKGNFKGGGLANVVAVALNESPSEKEGK